MANDITNMTPEQIAKEATAMLNAKHIQNHNFFTRGTTIVDQIDGQQFTSHYEILRFGSVNNYVHNHQNEDRTRVTSLTDVVNLIQNAI